MRFGNKKLSLWIVSAFLASDSWAGPQERPLFNAWAAYFRPAQARKAVDEYAGRLNELSVFAMQFDPAGRLVPAHPSVTELISKVRREHPRLRLLLTIVNDVGHDIEKDPETVHRLISDPKARRKHIQDLIALAGGVDGLDIDYENLRKEDGNSFIVFIEELAQALHERQKYLSVTIEPSTRFASRLLDWRPLGAAADRVRVMGYNFSYGGTPPGPISSPKDIGILADYALARIPAGKLEIALPLHGFDWPDKRKGKEIDHLSDILSLARDKRAEIQRDPESGAPHFSYQDDAGATHQVWFEDSQSVRQKAGLLVEKGIVNIGLWHLGSGDLKDIFQ